MSETGRTLRIIRRDAGLTLRAMAASMGFSAAFLCQVELGQRRFPRQRIQALPAAIREQILAALRADIVAEAEGKLERMG